MHGQIHKPTRWRMRYELPYLFHVTLTQCEVYPEEARRQRAVQSRCGFFYHPVTHLSSASVVVRHHRTTWVWTAGNRCCVPIHCTPVMQSSTQGDRCNGWYQHGSEYFNSQRGSDLISQHHPVSDIPAFFIHPCNTQEGLLPHQSGQEISPYGYLLLWLGLVGPSVGLYMPSQLVAAD